MAALPRELSITYGGVTVGGTSPHYLLDGYRRGVQSWNHAYVEFDVVVKGSSEPDFATKCAALEANFTDPDHALVVQQGTQTLLAFAAAPKDWCRPTITKRGDPQTDSGRSRGYTIRIDVDPAATQLSPSGLRDVSVDVAYSPARRRTVTVAGVWTAIASDGSREAYEAGIESYAAARLAELGGTYELAEEPQTSRDRPDHLIAFRRVYLERLWQEGGAALDDPDIVRQSAVFRRRRTAPGDSLKAPAAAGSNPIEGAGTSAQQPFQANVRRLTVIDVTYSAWIEKSVTDLVSKWESIRDWLIGVVQQDFGLGGMALTEEAPALDYDENRIMASMTLVGPEGGNVYEQQITVTTNVNEDQVLIPAWTGQPYDCYPYDGPRVLTRTVAYRAVVAGHKDDQFARERVKGQWPSGTQGIDQAESGAWTRGHVTSSATLKTMGMEGQTLEVTEIQGTITRRFFRKVENGRGGGGSPTSGGGSGPRPAVTP